MRRALVGFLLLVGPTVADEVTDAADAVLAAQDPAALKTLAEKNEPDPWLVADALCARGEFEAAERFAKAAPRADVSKLAAYVATQPRNAEARVAYKKARAALVAKDAKGALALLPETDGVSVVGIRILTLRGKALSALRQFEQSGAGFTRAALKAEQLGWLRRAADSYLDVARSAKARGDLVGMLRACETLLALQERRGDPGGVAGALVGIGGAHEELRALDKARAALEKAITMFAAMDQDDKLVIASAAAARINLARVYVGLSDFDRAIALLTEARRSLERIGDKTYLPWVLANLADANFRRADYKKARPLFEEAIPGMTALGNPRGEAWILWRLGACYVKLAEYDRGLKRLERVVEDYTKRGNKWVVANAQKDMGLLLLKRGPYTVALERLKAAHELYRAMGPNAINAWFLLDLGWAHAKVGEYDQALVHFERARELVEKGDRQAKGAVLLNLGNLLDHRGEYKKALRVYREAVAAERAVKNRNGEAGALANVGIVLWRLARWREAIEAETEAKTIYEERKDNAGIARALTNLGLIHQEFGNLKEALRCEEEALALARRSGDRNSIAIALNNVGAVHLALGNLARAFSLMEQALGIAREIGARAFEASVLGDLASAATETGQYERARTYYERALVSHEQLGAKLGAARTRRGLGRLLNTMGDSKGAIAQLESALKLYRDLGTRGGEADVLRVLANVHAKLDQLDEARHFVEQARAIYEEIQSPLAETWIRTKLAQIHEKKQEFDQAKELYRAAREAAERGQDLSSQVECLTGEARVARGKAEAAEAIALARIAVERVRPLLRGLGEEQGASVRDRWEGPYVVGTWAARDAGDAAAACFFLESGRAGALLESLAGQEALRAVSVPQALWDEELEARAGERHARAVYLDAVKAGKRKEIFARKKELDAARERRLQITGRIRRAAKGAADLLYPEAKSLETIQARLEKGDVLILYALYEQSVALVVTPDAARIVDLGAGRTNRRACAAFELTDPEPLRKLVVDPLALPADTRRVLVSPHGPLSYVPMALLFPEQEVTHVPSGTTYDWLREDEGKKGKGVLALGYGLPGAKKEAQAIGDTILVDEGATKAALRDALPSETRWRAVHLACHGVVDAQRPMLSSLALAAAGEEDGALHAHELYRIKIPADLVVLSACETGKGKVYAAEGVVGFTRAFMFAGAPRVIVSLWKVDDAATRALMEKFYAAWKGGASTAGALKQAQQFVAGQEKWKHPRYWAAWQLWGLPD